MSNTPLPIRYETEQTNGCHLHPINHNPGKRVSLTTSEGRNRTMTIAQDLSSALDEVATLRFIYIAVDSPRGAVHFKRLSRYLRSMDRAMRGKT